MTCWVVVLTLLNLSIIMFSKRIFLRPSKYDKYGKFLTREMCQHDLKLLVDGKRTIISSDILPGYLAIEHDGIIFYSKSWFFRSVGKISVLDMIKIWDEKKKKWIKIDVIEKDKCQKKYEELLEKSFTAEKNNINELIAKAQEKMT